jgi:Protein of unknown function (DUF3592)
MTVSAAKSLFTAIGLIMLVGSLVVYAHTALVPHQSTDYSTSNGSVSRVTTSYSYQPVVQFQHGGQRIQFADSVASNPPAYHVGDAVNVLYLESDPYKAGIDSFTSLWFLPLLFGGLGAIFLAVGVRMIRGSRPDAVPGPQD